MAGLIPQNFIDELLSRVDIVDVIDKRIKLRKTGKNYSALCPFHKEKSPSFSVQPEKQFYYCFGCGAGGNALGFVMEYDNKDFPQAVESLATDYGLSVPREENREQEQQRGENQQLLNVLSMADSFFQQQLRSHPGRKKAVDYLKGRGLTGQIAKQFGIGFAPPGWDNLLNHLRAASISTDLMMKSGLVIERDTERAAEQGKEQNHGHYDRFRDRIIFPIRDNRGRVIAFGGRVLGDDKPKYLNSPETPVYHKGQELYGLYEARKSKSPLTRMLIVEGYMDVVALAQHGINYAVATLGTATNTTHLSRLFRVVPEVIYCFDGDAAGRTAAWRGLQATLPVMQDGRKVRFLFLPDGEDPDTLVRKIGKDRFSAMIEQASNLEDFLFDHLAAQVDMGSMEGKARLATLAAPLLMQLPAGIFRQLMRKRLAELTGVDNETIDQLLMDKSSSTPPAEPAPDPYPESGDLSYKPVSSLRPPTAAARRVSERPASVKAIELLLYCPDIGLSITQNLQPLQELRDTNTDLLLELIELVKHNPAITTYAMLGHCYGTALGNQLTQLMKNEQITPAAGIKAEFTFLIDSIIANAQKLKYRELLIKQLKPRLKGSTNAEPSEPE
jgi:DNA primase